MAKSTKTSPENSKYMLYVVMNDDTKEHYYSQPKYDSRGGKFQFEYLLNNVLLGKRINNDYKRAIFYNADGKELTRVTPGSSEKIDKFTRSYYKLLIITKNNEFRYVYCNPELNKNDKNALFQEMMKTEVVNKLKNEYKRVKFYDVRTGDEIFTLDPTTPHILNSRYKLFIDVNGVKKCRMYFFSFPFYDNNGPEFQISYMTRSILEKKLLNRFKKAIFEDIHTKEIIKTIIN